jgi:hypothetical protein
VNAALSPRDAALLKLGVLTVLKNRVTEAERDARNVVSGLLAKGDNSTVSNPANPEQAIVEVNKSKPKSRAIVESRRDVEAWIRANYPGKTETKTVIIGSQADVVDVLREHAPFLLDKVTEIPDYVVNELVLKSQAAGEPVGFGGEIGEKAPPGITVSAPEGTLRVIVQDGGADIVEEMWAAGLVDLDGQLVALPAGGAE